MPTMFGRGRRKGGLLEALLPEQRRETHAETAMRVCTRAGENKREELTTNDKLREMLPRYDMPVMFGTEGDTC